MPKWLSPKQVAEELGVTPSSVYRWMRQGTLKYYTTPGGTIRISEDDLLKE